MYIVDGIAYAGELEPMLQVVGVRPLNDFRLWVRFNNDEVKIFDFKLLLHWPTGIPLTAYILITAFPRGMMVK